LQPRWNVQRGFSLVEVLVAASIMSTATIAIALLSVVAVRANRIARTTTVSTALAVQKMEQLQSAGWTELVPSPPKALQQNTDGYCDFLDTNGRTLPEGTSPPAGAAFVRRWALDSLTASNALVIQVSVIPISGTATAVVSRRPEEARIVGIRSQH
jgi:prepilin-type N-terminal cleavage/methylation domain-containing protein